MLQQQHFEYTLYAYLGLYGDFEGARVCGRLAIVTQYGHGLGEALWHHHAGHAIYDHLWEHDRITLSVEEEYDVGDCGDFDIDGDDHWIDRCDGFNEDSSLFPWIADRADVD